MRGLLCGRTVFLLILARRNVSQLITHDCKRVELRLHAKFATDFTVSKIGITKKFLWDDFEASPHNFVVVGAIGIMAPME